MDEYSNCGHSITGDIKIYQCHMIKRYVTWLNDITTPNEEVLKFLLPKFYKSNSSIRN